MSQQLKRDLSICCSGFYDADLVGGKIILRCVRCGRRWRHKADGTFERVPLATPEVNHRKVLGRQFGGDPLVN